MKTTLVAIITLVCTYDVIHARSILCNETIHTMCTLQIPRIRDGTNGIITCTEPLNQGGQEMACDVAIPVAGPGGSGKGGNKEVCTYVGRPRKGMFLVGYESSSHPGFELYRVKEIIDAVTSAVGEEYIDIHPDPFDPPVRYRCRLQQLVSDRYCVSIIDSTCWTGLHGILLMGAVTDIPTIKDCPTPLANVGTPTDPKQFIACLDIDYFPLTTTTTTTPAPVAG